MAHKQCTHTYMYIYSAKAERTLLQLQPMFAKDETRLELIFPAIVDIPAIGCRPCGLNRQIIDGSETMQTTVTEKKIE